MVKNKFDFHRPVYFLGDYSARRLVNVPGLIYIPRTLIDIKSGLLSDFKNRGTSEKTEVIMN